jgi:integrase
LRCQVVEIGQSAITILFSGQRLCIEVAPKANFLSRMRLRSALFRASPVCCSAAAPFIKPNSEVERPKCRQIHQHFFERSPQLRRSWRRIPTPAKAAGFLTPVGCHTWRATGITIYLENDVRLEHARQMAGHESPRTTKLYDRTKDEITLSEVERIRL